MRKTAVLGMLFLFTALLFSGCSRQHRMIKKLQDAIVQEQPEDFKITVYFLSPWFMVNRAISVEEMLTFEEELEVFHLSGQEAYNSVQIIRECLQEDMIEPVKQSGCMNARLYYVLENKVEEKILEIIVYAKSDTVYFNGVEVKANGIFYQIIYPCLGDKADLLWQYLEKPSQ